MKKTIHGNRFLVFALVLALSLSVLLSGSSAIAADDLTSVQINNLLIRFGDPNVDPPTWPESDMRFSWGGMPSKTINASYKGHDSETFQPDTLALWVTAGDDSNLTLSNFTNQNLKFVTYDQDGTETLRDLVTYAMNGNSNLFIVKLTGAATVKITGHGNGLVDLILPSPSNTPPPPPTDGDTPYAVNGYLTGMSQFAGHRMWGSISVSELIGHGDNLLTDPYKVKFLDGDPDPDVVALNPGGISLGSLGGFVQFEFDVPITDDANNKYGTDFIVYGNPFVGNPEAAAVQVATKGPDGKPGQWYELAGSRYYDGDTVRNATVEYAMQYEGGNPTHVTTTLNGAPVITTKLDGTTGPTFSDRTVFPYDESWFPWPSDFNHLATSGFGGGFIGAHLDAFSDSVLRFKGVTCVPDDDQRFFNAPGDNQLRHEYYQFGYADIHSNYTDGTSKGVPANPYAISYNGEGGDGFDLAWAVNIETGEPANLSGEDIYFVRVYSAVLYDTGIFGETSAEVTWIQKTTPEGSPVGQTAAPAITVGGTPVTITGHNQVVEVKTGSPGTKAIEVSSTADNVYINSAAATSATVTVAFSGSQLVRVIVQDGDAQPYIVLLKISRA